MEKLMVVTCLVLLAGVALAFPGSGSWRRAVEDLDRDVEAVDPVRGGGSRGGARGQDRPAPAASDSDERPEVVPFGIGFGLSGLGGLGGLGGLAGRGGFAIRPVIATRRDSTEDSDEDLPGGYVPTGILHPYFLDPMSSFMAQMAEMMTAMRRQMNQVLNRLPNDGTDFSKLGNTTSTTKVVDGHVVTVNETVIGGEDGDDSLIRIRVVDVHPSESPESAEGAGSAGSAGSPGTKGDTGDADQGDKDAEPLGSEEATSRPNRADNEIPMKVGSEVDDLNA